jgi:hypothetical protein
MIMRSHPACYNGFVSNLFENVWLAWIVGVWSRGSKLLLELNSRSKLLLELNLRSNLLLKRLAKKQFASQAAHKKAICSLKQFAL